MRVCPAYIRKVSHQDPLLALLVGVCRGESQARQELRWMRQELVDPARVRWACKLRSRQVPLQHVLGSQPFGAIDVLCRPQVLIPRWETEEWVCDLTSRLAGMRLQIVDLCTGTGCVALHLQRSLSAARVTAVDCSASAIALAQCNAGRNELQLRLLQRDVLGWQPDEIGRVDLVVCNPPYIPPDKLVRDARASVRFYEPRLALVGDKEFYENLVRVWLSRTRAFVYEVGSEDQCAYVKKHAGKEWIVGTRKDARGEARVVYGYRDGDSEFARVFKGYDNL